jgi:hypothetical protein
MLAVAQRKHLSRWGRLLPELSSTLQRKDLSSAQALQEQQQTLSTGKLLDTIYLFKRFFCIYLGEGNFPFGLYDISL